MAESESTTKLVKKEKEMSKQKRKPISARGAVADAASGRGSSYLKLPKGIELFEPDKKVYRLDFMPFICGDENPSKAAVPGEPYTERRFSIHKGVGPDEEWVVCPAKSLRNKRPCPICEYLKKKTVDPDMDPDELKELKKSIGAKERRIYLVRDLDEDGVDGRVLVYDASYYTFGQVILDKITSADEEDGYDFFADPEEGLVVRVSFKRASGGSWLEVADLEFRKRKHSYDPDIAEKMPSLDDMIQPMSYKEIRKLFMASEEDDEEETAPRKSRQRSRFDDDDDEPAPKKRRPVRDDDDDDEPTPKNRRPVRDDDDDDDDPAPRRAKPKPIEDEEEESPPEKSKPKKDHPKSAHDEGLAKGDLVKYSGEECTILKISKDGTSLVLEGNDSEEIYRPIGVDDVEFVIPSKDIPEPEKEEEKKDKPKKKESEPDDDGGDDDADGGDEDEDEGSWDFEDDEDE